MHHVVECSPWDYNRALLELKKKLDDMQSRMIFRPLFVLCGLLSDRKAMHAPMILERDSRHNISHKDRCHWSEANLSNIGEGIAHRNKVDETIPASHNSSIYKDSTKMQKIHSVSKFK